MFSSGYLQLSLASDQAAGALVQDPALLGPWGMSANPADGDLWVVNSVSGLATHYSGLVGASPSVFQTNTTTIGGLGSQPRGDAFNSGAGFAVQPGNPGSSASLIFAAQDGTISAWNSDVPPPAPSPAAQTEADISGAEYTGVAVENDASRQFVYAADFHDGRIDVFDGGFNRVTPAGGFTDPNLPAGYAPFNIINTGAALLVSFAQQDANRQNAVPALGGGIIDEFDYAGNFERTLVSGGPANPASKLNAPWGMAVAPASFGDFSGDLLVANTGNGKINAFDPTTGAYYGTLSNPAGNPLIVSGLHGLVFGNGVAGNANTLFFTAAGSNGQHGLLGEIVSAQNNLFPAAGSAITTAARDTVSGMVAVFNDVNAAPASSFLAEISWGDGGTELGTVVALPSGGYGVLGSHSYFAPGQNTVTVTIYDAHSATATVTDAVDVTPPRLIFTTGAPTATEGLPFTGSLATFTDQDGNSLLSWYQASIDWGDGTATAGTITGYSPFTVSGSHTYTQQGNKPIAITVTDNDGSVGTASVAASVVSSLAGKGLTIQPTEGTPFTAAVASFTDANSGHSLSDYGATIHWGDGGAAPGTIAANGSGGFNVSGIYNYMTAGTENITVTISDTGSTITVAGTALVADGNTLTATAAAVSGSQGTAFSGAVATFTDTFPAAPGIFAASIDWGDGATSDGTVSVTAGVFTVSGAHTYLDNGAFSVTATVHDIGGTAGATVHATATIADANVLHATPASVTAVAGQTLTAALATVSDDYKGAVAGQFSAKIVWGDGDTSSGTVSGGNGLFTVSGSHVYSSQGAQTATVIVTEKAPGTASSTATVGIQVAAAPPAVTVAGISGHAQSAFAGAVAMFTQAGSSAVASDFTASIRWGDGTSSSGTITGAASGFTVAGTHTYANEGHFTLAVTVARDGGGSTTASGLATILGPRLADGTYGTPDTRWVNDVYGDLLHRPADTGALAYWGTELAGGVPRQYVVSSIEASAEYRGDEVQTVYQTYLHRAAETAAATYFTQYLTNHSREQLSAIVIGSAEYYNVRGGGANDGFLDALFEDVLHRPIDPGARSFFAGQLGSGVSDAQVAAEVLGSDEYSRDLVNSFYLALLDRPADSGGLNFFANQLEHGGSDGQVIAIIAASDEYFAKTAE
ncbi:MAG TPA: TIGR03118 family protein [Pirellulales bacterium]